MDNADTSGGLEAGQESASFSVVSILSGILWILIPVLMLAALIVLIREVFSLPGYYRDWAFRRRVLADEQAYRLRQHLEAERKWAASMEMRAKEAELKAPRPIITKPASNYKCAQKRNVSKWRR